jgi:hypothetical protein
MTQPEQIAAQLDDAWAGWAVLYGSYSRQFIAFPAAPLTLPAEHAGLITAKDHRELERRMSFVQRGSGHRWLALPTPKTTAPPTARASNPSVRAAGRPKSVGQTAGGIDELPVLPIDRSPI